MTIFQAHVFTSFNLQKVMCTILIVELMLLCSLQEFKAPLIRYLIHLFSISLSPVGETALS